MGVEERGAGTWPAADRTRHAADPGALPVWSVAMIGGLSLICLVLALVIASLTRPATAAASAPATTSTPATASTPEGTAQDATSPAATASGAPRPAASFSADPAPIPVAMLTALEAAGEAPIEAELTALLEAVGHGFGTQSARLEPTLQAYVYRAAGRLGWAERTARVAVTAPDPALATARGALLERLFADAIAAGRLEVGVGVGPHRLTLVPLTAE